MLLLLLLLLRGCAPPHPLWGWDPTAAPKHERASLVGLNPPGKMGFGGVWMAQSGRVWGWRGRLRTQPGAKREVGEEDSPLCCLVAEKDVFELQRKDF